MEPNLATTNVLLGFMAAVSVLEAPAVGGFVLGAFLFYRRLRQDPCFTPTDRYRRVGGER